MTPGWRFLPLLALLILTACTDAEPGRTSTTDNPTSDVAAAPDRVEGQRLLDGELADLPLLRTQLPRRLPRQHATLPSLLDDPPGRALMTYHPPEMQFAGPQGWASEDILFYGEDKRWRLLRMEDLALPEADWIADTYGAGSLSADGRWWAGMTGRGAVVVDLTTGSHQVIEGAGYMVTPTWIPGEDAFVALTFLRGRSPTVRVSISDGEITRAPYRQHEVGFEPDGSALTAKRDASGALTLYEWGSQTKSVRVVLSPQIPTNGRSGIGVKATSGRFASSTQRASDNYNRITFTVVSSIDGEVEARLQFNVQRLALYGGGHWLDPETFLLPVEGHVVAWRPLAGEMYRTMKAPSAPPDHYWSVAFAGEER